MSKNCRCKPQVLLRTNQLVSRHFKAVHDVMWHSMVGFVRAALLPAVGTCVVLSFGVLPGWSCFLRVTLHYLKPLHRAHQQLKPRHARDRDLS